MKPMAVVIAAEIPPERAAKDAMTPMLTMPSTTAYSVIVCPSSRRSCDVSLW